MVFQTTSPIPILRTLLNWPSSPLTPTSKYCQCHQDMQPHWAGNQPLTLASHRYYYIRWLIHRPGVTLSRTDPQFALSLQIATEAAAGLLRVMSTYKRACAFLNANPAVPPCTIFSTCNTVPQQQRRTLTLNPPSRRANTPLPHDPPPQPIRHPLSNRLLRRSRLHRLPRSSRHPGGEIALPLGRRAPPRPPGPRAPRLLPRRAGAYVLPFSLAEPLPAPPRYRYRCFFALTCAVCDGVCSQ